MVIFLKRSWNLVTSHQLHVLKYWLVWLMHSPAYTNQEVTVSSPYFSYRQYRGIFSFGHESVSINTITLIILHINRFRLSEHDWIHVTIKHFSSSDEFLPVLRKVALYSLIMTACPYNYHNIHVLNYCQFW